MSGRKEEPRYSENHHKHFKFTLLILQIKIQIPGKGTDRLTFYFRKSFKVMTSSMLA